MTDAGSPYMIVYELLLCILEAGENPALCLSNRDFYEVGTRKASHWERPGKASAEVIRNKSGNCG